MTKKKSNGIGKTLSWVIPSLIGLAFLVLIILFFTGVIKLPTLTGQQIIKDTTIIERLINPQNPAGVTCSLTLTPNIINVGDLVTGKIRDGKNTLCEVFVKEHGSSWEDSASKIWEGTTDAFGNLQTSENIWVEGQADFIAICGDCVTNEALLTVNPTTTSTCTDSDGKNKLIAGHVTSDVGTFYDKCVDDNSVTEFWCDGDTVTGTLLSCDAGYSCFETRSGGYCMLDSTDPQPGDVISSEESEHLISNADTSFVIEMTPGDNQLQLCAEIERSSYKSSPMCNAIPSDLEDWATFVFLDSTGNVWERNDQIFAGQEGGPDTYGNPDVLHVYYDGQTNFKGYMSHSGPCPMNMKMKVTIVVCE